MKHSVDKTNAKHLRRLKPGVLALIIIMSLLVLLGGTWSWFTAYEAKKNELKAAQYQFNAELVDVFTPPSEIVEGGDTVSKKVAATNNGDIDAFVRLMVFPTIVGTDTTTPLDANIGEQILIDINTDYWVDGKDGYYYYLGVIKPGEETPPLFNEVTLADAFPGSYTSATLNIDVKCEAVSTEKWSYRVGWWGSDAAPTGELTAIDNALKQLAQ